MSKRHLLLLAGLLTFAGLGLFFYKYSVLGFPLERHAEADIWTVEARVSFRPRRGPVKVVMQLPHQPPGFVVMDETFVSRGYGLTTREEDGNRRVQWAIRRANGPQALYYRSVVYRDTVETAEPRPPGPPPPVPELEEPHRTALQALVDDVRIHSADISSFTAEMLKRLNAKTAGEYIALFADSGASPTERAETAKMLLAGARITARITHGIRVQEQQRRAQMIPWLEVHNENRWLYFDPATGDRYLPEDLFIWWRGDAPLIDVEGGRSAEVEFAVQRNVIDAMMVAERRSSRLGSRVPEFSLFGLPIQTQAVYGVLLLVPLGAFVLVIMRNIIGVTTFGTFMPVLVALAFRETQLVSGVILFSLVVTLGLGIRFYLERLRLLLVPRLASVLIVVVLLMVLVSVVSNQLGLETGLSVALFPMVILTMVIERMSVVWEERGPMQAINEGLGSLFVAAVAYLVMGIDYLEHIVFVFPELLLVLLAVMLLLGRYSGYRLFEFFRFKALPKRVN